MGICLESVYARASKFQSDVYAEVDAFGGPLSVVLPNSEVALFGPNSWPYCNCFMYKFLTIDSDNSRFNFRISALASGHVAWYYLEFPAKWKSALEFWGSGGFFAWVGGVGFFWGVWYSWCVGICRCGCIGRNYFWLDCRRGEYYKEFAKPPAPSAHPKLVAMRWW